MTVTQGKGWKYKGFFAAAYATDPITGEESEVILWFQRHPSMAPTRPPAYPPTHTKTTNVTHTNTTTLPAPPPHTHRQLRHLISLLLAPCGPVSGMPGGTDSGTPVGGTTAGR